MGSGRDNLDPNPFPQRKKTLAQVDKPGELKVIGADFIGHDANNPD